MCVCVRVGGLVVVVVLVGWTVVDLGYAASVVVRSTTLRENGRGESQPPTSPKHPSHPRQDINVHSTARLRRLSLWSRSSSLRIAQFQFPFHNTAMPAPFRGFISTAGYSWHHVCIGHPHPINVVCRVE